MYRILNKLIATIMVLTLYSTHIFAETIEKSQDNTGYNVYQIFLIAYFILMIFTIVKGAGENRSIIIFKDYNDLGLTFLMPASFVLIMILFTSLGGDTRYGLGLSFIVSLGLLGLIVKNTYIINNSKIGSTILVLLTKIPLSIIWITSFVMMLKPSGSTAAERRSTRGTAMIVLAILTPIIGLVVANKEGSLFNPKDWIKGRRVGGMRNHL